MRGCALRAIRDDSFAGTTSVVVGRRVSSGQGRLSEKPEKQMRPVHRQRQNLRQKRVRPPTSKGGRYMGNGKTRGKEPAGTPALRTPFAFANGLARVSIRVIRECSVVGARPDG
jgi:hypothetical protein